MKKLDTRGFIMAETLVVSLFLMTLFTMIYTNFFPIIGEYEKRENYDDVDGKYTAYWIKKMVESEYFTLKENDYVTMNKYGYIRFECGNMSEENGQRETCISLVKFLEIANCDNFGNGCDAFITRYKIGGSDEEYDFKKTVREKNVTRAREECAYAGNTTCPEATTLKENCCKSRGIPSCDDSPDTKIKEYCEKFVSGRAISSGLKDYILTLPDFKYKRTSIQANYRVIVATHHQKDKSEYYAFSTIEVVK